MSPQRPDLVLSAHVPDIEARVLVGDCFDVEAHCWYCVDLHGCVVSDYSCGIVGVTSAILGMRYVGETRYNYFALQAFIT